MRLVEIFHSIQGEGFLVGVPSVFIRLAGCPFKCRWCDSEYAQDEKEGTDYTVEQIVENVQQYQASHVVITGGEPMINQDLTKRPKLPLLVESLKEIGKHITIETVGIAFIPDMPCDLMSISPKLSNSITPDSSWKQNGIKKIDIAVLRCLLDEYNYQLKFVVDTKNDLVEIQELLGELGKVDLDKVMLMPQAATREQFLVKAPMVVEMCKEPGFAFTPRLQTIIWDCEKGK